MKKNSINMQTIDFINGKGYKVITFPDGELHLELEEINRKDDVDIRCRITNGNNLFLLMQLSDILRRQCIIPQHIYIHYLMGMRCDRLFDLNRPFTLGIVSEVINSFNAEQVIVTEPHSIRTLDEIKNCIPDNTSLQAACIFENNGYKLVAPDAGAKERYYIPFSVICSKKRNVNTGELLGFEVSEVKSVRNKHLVVIDDLCDGGGTFVGLASKLRELKPKSLSLFVTHMVNSEGIERVSKVYDHVYFTKSYCDWSLYNYANRTVIEVGEMKKLEEEARKNKSKKQDKNGK